ncbi:MAG: hypothetical protein ABIJ14_03040 [Nanoarchaeota archaeon]|nr:hypothetical protein [Nanoarchaeota archaeon]
MIDEKRLTLERKQNNLVGKLGAVGGFISFNAMSICVAVLESNRLELIKLGEDLTSLFNLGYCASVFYAGAGFLIYEFSKLSERNLDLYSRNKLGRK